MALNTFIVLLLFLNYTLADENCVINETPEYITSEKQLLEDLRCGYSPHQAPKEATTINVTFFIRGFHFHIEEGMLAVQAWVEMKWKDERLKWDPEKYHGINETDVSNFYMWTPNLRISNSEDLFDSYTSFYRYEVKSTGDVHCYHHMLQETWCSIKLTNWPYDVQECSFQFSSTEKSRHARNYTLNFNFIVIDPEGAEWYIIDYKHVNDNSTKKPALISVFLMREAVGLSAIVVYPAFILTVLSILSLCLDVRRRVRLAIICFSLMGHYYFFMELAANIPTQSHFPPTLLSYYRGSLVVSVIIILLTFFLAAMCKFKSTPHNYVKLINDFVYENNYRTYLVYPRWDFDDATVDSKSSNEDWMKFANIVNSVSIFCVVFAYIGMYATDIPKRTYSDVYDNFIRISLKPGEFS